MLSDESYGGKKRGKRMGRPRELGGGVRARREEKIPNSQARWLLATTYIPSEMDLSFPSRAAVYSSIDGLAY